MKCVIEIVVEDGGVGEAKMAKVDERVVVGRGGSVEKVRLPFLIFFLLLSFIF